MPETKKMSNGILKSQLIDITIVTTEMLHLFDKKFNTLMITVFHKQLQT